MHLGLVAGDRTRALIPDELGAADLNAFLSAPEWDRLAALAAGEGEWMPLAEVTLPAYSDVHDRELELAVVIGAEAFRVSRDEALAHVAGYTIVNDITMRDLVFRQD